MKSASAGLAAHLAQEVTTLAWCWKITRRDGQVFGFTNHDRDLTFGGVTYRADSGFTGSAAQARAGASVDNMEVVGLIEGNVITEADILAGVWDGASVDVYVVNWASLSQGPVVIQTGYLGSVGVRGGVFLAEIRSLSVTMNNPVGRVMTRRCDANLGDSRCNVNLLNYTVSGSVINVSPDNMQIEVTAVPLSAGGRLTWTGGANNGYSVEIKNVSASTIMLSLPPLYQINVGDTYTAHAGCDKNLSTCKNIFSNVVNFRGFPHIPGVDKMLAYPDAK